MNERVLLLLVACLCFGLSLLATLLTGPSRLGALQAFASLAGLVVALWLMVDVRRARQAASTPPTPLSVLPRGQRYAYDQGEYAALLHADVKHQDAFHAWGSGSDEAANCVRCQRRAKGIAVYHPIWDGPFDDAGSGNADRRFLWWCAGCDGPAPESAGPPVRLPYLDNLPIRLLPELYERPAFHSLHAKVERYVPPPPAPASPLGPLRFGPEAAATEKETP